MDGPHCETRAQEGEGSDDLRVSTLELFFDLVFVFTLTQLSSLLEHGLTLETTARVILIFVVLFWMYGGYGWLTNQVPPDRAGRRLLLIFGMAAFLLCALAIPRAFGEGGVAFGLGYLTVVVVHAGLYAQVYGRRRVAMLATLNVLAALSVIAAAGIGGVAAYLLWVAAIVVQFVTPTLVGQGVALRPRHFVERHGLLLLIALGESVVAVGIGIGDVAPDVRVFLTAVLGLGLATALWWVYFVSDEAAAEEAMVRASPRERFILAIRAYFFAFIPMLLGIIVAAAGVEHAVGHTAEQLEQGPALALSVGVAAYLWGNVLFRQSLGIMLDRSWPRVAAGAAALGTVVLGVAGTALAELVGLVAVLVVLLTYEATRQIPVAQRSRCNHRSDSTR